MKNEAEIHPKKASVKMKRNQKQADDIEILKAVAQAWYGHSGSSKAGAAAATSEFDAHRMYFKGRPSRFKVEAMNSRASSIREESGRSWDFGQSLWDSYEIISVSKKLERGLALEDQLSEGKPKKRKESKNSLRNLFNKMSSRRFNDVD